MDVDNMLKEREELEYIVDNCKFETPEQICELFEAYTNLIWKHKQVGRIYDFYHDNLMVQREGGADVIGLDRVVADTLAALAAFPDLQLQFYCIHGTGNPTDGFRFGQVVHYTGTFLGVSKYGLGTGATFDPHEAIGLCECTVRKINGKWRVGEEWLVRGSASFGSVFENALPFLNDVAVPKTTVNECCCENKKDTEDSNFSIENSIDETDLTK